MPENSTFRWYYFRGGLQMDLISGGKKEMVSNTGKQHPPGRTKIAEALKLLLEKKSFNQITTAEIAKKAGVTESLIYKYFKDKRDLLHQILSDYVVGFTSQMKQDVERIEGAENKLRRLIWLHFQLYNTNRVLAKILLLEVRNCPDYFKSETYQIIRDYGDLVIGIIKDGMQQGEIRDDISPSSLRQVILGGIEHLILPAVIFNFKANPEALTESICKIIFGGAASEKVP
jgi:AcrR family transcriptional regulator